MEFYENRGHNPFHCEPTKQCAACNRGTHEIGAVCEDCRIRHLTPINTHDAQIRETQWFRWLQAVVVSHETIAVIAWQPLALDVHDD